MIREYGKVIQTYRGKGKVKFANADELPCRVTIQQVETGLVLVSCIFTSASDRAMALQHASIDSVHGQAADGLKFETRGQVLAAKWNHHITDSSRRLVLTLIAREVALWPRGQVHASYYKFRVVNFEFIGNHPAKRIIANGTKQVEHFYRDLELKTPWGIAVADPVPDYDDVVHKIKAQKGISVTCEVFARPSLSMELAEVTSKLDELCRLFSLARGTKITWINAEGYTEDGHLHQVILKTSVTWPFSHFAVIDTRNPEDIAVFIQKAYPAYLELRKLYNLDVAIDLYLDAKRETAYLETRALAAVVLLDFLQQRYASQHGFDQIIDDFGGQKGKEFRDRLRELILSFFSNIYDDNLKEMLDKTPELNRRSYLNLLKLWTCHLGLKIPRHELSRVRDTRHALAHKGEFTSADPREKLREYYRVTNIIDQAFLKLLNYDGYFIHVDTSTLSFDRKKLA